MLICQHPITVYIEGEPVKMPCGHCKYCLQQKANRIAEQISLEYITSPVVLYCTLTYAPEHLPQANVTCTYADGFCHQQITSLHNFAFSTTYDNKLLNSHKFSKYEISKNYQSGFVPVLCRSHVTNFLKRVRRYLQYNNLGKVRYYYCGEYGYKYGRPHYHALLFCESQTQATKLEQNLSTLWHYGHVDIQRARTACSRYLGSYLSGSYSCKFGTRSTSYPPFNSHSNRLGYKATHIQYVNNIMRGYRQKSDCRSIYRACRTPISMADATLSSLPLWSSYTSSLLPKCPGFSRLDSIICRRLYTISSELAKIFTSKQNFLRFWRDYVSGFCKSTFTLSQVNLVDFLTHCYCSTCKNTSIIDSIHNNTISSAVVDKFSKWLDKVLSVSKKYIFSSKILGISTYHLYDVIRDFYDAQNFNSLCEQLLDFEQTKFGPEEMVYTYCNLPHYPIYLHHNVPDLVIQKRIIYEEQIQKSIYKKSHLF